MLAQLIQKLSNVYHTPCFDPHITLLHTLGKARTFVRCAQHIASWLPAFQVQLHQLRHSESFFKHIFIDLKPHVRLLESYQASHTCLNRAVTQSYQAHISLVYGALSARQREQILAQIKLPEQVWTITKIQVVALGAGQAMQLTRQWRVVDEVDLQAGL